MAGTTILEQVRAALREMSARTEGLVETLPDTGVPMPGSKWTVREAGVHLVNVGVRYAAMVQGEPLGYASLAPEECARMNDQLIADIPESDPVKLAALMHDGTERLLEATARCDDEQTVLWHCQFHIPVPNLLAIATAEHLVHGYDIALAAERPWPISAAEAGTALFGYGAAYGLCLNPATTAGHTAGYAIEFRTGERFTIRFVDGEYQVEPPDAGPVDCTITADPAAFLLVGAGRVSQWQAIALGAMEVGGDRPDLALSFGDRFLFP
ncbi:MAG: maleylpyruvate isomerase N-terminal domain-containing protein [Acidimicrobiia bacterium]